MTEDRPDTGTDASGTGTTSADARIDEHGDIALIDDPAAPVEAAQPSHPGEPVDHESVVGQSADPPAGDDAVIVLPTDPPTRPAVPPVTVESTQAAEPAESAESSEARAGDANAHPTQPEPQDEGQRHSHRGPGRWRRPVKIGLPVATMLAAGGLLLTGTGSPLPVTDVQVHGASTSLQTDLAGVLAGVGDQSFRSIDYEALAGAISAVDGVGAVDFDWAWPSVLAITIDEQVPFAMRGNKQDGFVILDRDGQKITRQQGRPAGLPMVAPTENADLAEAQRDVLAALPEDLRERVRRVAGKSPDRLVLYLSNGPKVRWGAVTDTSAKSEVLRGLLPLDAEEISVEVPSRPTLRGLPQPDGDSATP